MKRQSHSSVEGGVKIKFANVSRSAVTIDFSGELGGAMLCIGEEIGIFGLSSRVELNGKRAWIVAPLAAGRYGVWLGSISDKPMAIKSENVEPTPKIPFPHGLASWGTPICPKQLKCAFADHLERPLASVLQRLAVPHLFAAAPEALIFPPKVLQHITDLMDAFMMFICEGYGFKSVRPQLEANLAERRRKFADPIVVETFTSLRDLRKNIEKVGSNLGTSSGMTTKALNIMPLLDLQELLCDGFDEQMNVLRQLPHLGEGHVGICLIVKLHDFEPTSLLDTFMKSTCINMIGCAKHMETRVELTTASQEMTCLEAVRELSNISAHPLYNEYRKVSKCAVCERRDFALSGSDARLQLCASCGVVAYCGKQHQKEHWKAHKPHCSLLKHMRDREAELEHIIEHAK